MNVWAISLNTIADLFVNLSAGMFGIVIVTPLFTKKSGKFKPKVLTGGLAWAILMLLGSLVFRIMANYGLLK